MPSRTPKILAAVATLAFCLAGQGSALAEKDKVSSGSVVQVRCVSDQGGSKATGFVWPTRGFVVTALHAVAACPTILVFSEPAEEQSEAKLESVLLEADLALLRLEDDMGLAPIAHQQEEPNTRDSYYIWGYPLVEEEMSGKRLEFADGYKGGVTSLGTAFASKQLDDLFATQSYPTEDTQILRVASTIQPGHSGAPILSTLDGRVVAIADGGLLDGWRGINWSIPAHIYLAQLKTSSDAFPTSRPEEKGLFSQATAVQGPATEIALKSSSGNHSEDGNSGGLDELILVRSLTLADLAAVMQREGDDFWGELVPSIHSIAQNLSSPPDLSFDIYEDFVTGSTIGVPAGLETFWDDEIGALVAFGESDSVALVVAVFRFDSYEEAREIAPLAFVDIFYEGIDWTEDPAGFQFDPENDGFEYANNAGFFAGVEQSSGDTVDLQISMTVSGRDFLGYAVLSVPDKMSDRDWVNHMMMQLGAAKLSDFALK